MLELEESSEGEGEDGDVLLLSFLHKNFQRLWLIIYQEEVKQNFVFNDHEQAESVLWLNLLKVHFNVLFGRILGIEPLTLCPKLGEFYNSLGSIL